MWPTTLSFPSPILPTSLVNVSNRKPFRLKASFSNYPLASRIMVRNLPYNTSESKLQKEFSAFGEVAEVKVVKDASTNRPKGYAFVQYTTQDDAMNALETMDQEIYDGRVIYIEIAKLNKGDFGGYPTASGPPKNRPLPELNTDLADCWY